MEMTEKGWERARRAIVELTHLFHDNAVQKGFYKDVDADDPRDLLSIVAKIHEELGEITQAISNPGRPSEKIASFTELEEEIADTFIRLLDFSAVVTAPEFIARAIQKKHEYNIGRSHRHGKAV